MTQSHEWCFLLKMNGMQRVNSLGRTIHCNYSVSDEFKNSQIERFLKQERIHFLTIPVRVSNVVVGTGCHQETLLPKLVLRENMSALVPVITESAFATARQTGMVFLPGSPSRKSFQRRELIACQSLKIMSASGVDDSPIANGGEAAVNQQCQILQDHRKDRSANRSR